MRCPIGRREVKGAGISFQIFLHALFQPWFATGAEREVMKRSTPPSHASAFQISLSALALAQSGIPSDVTCISR